MTFKKCLMALFTVLAAAAAVAGAAYVLLRWLEGKKTAPACIECDCGSEFEAE